MFIKSLLAPMFKELNALLGRNCDCAELVDKYKEQFEQIIACAKERAASKNQKQGLVSAPGAQRGIVSSAVPPDKRQKTSVNKTASYIEVLLRKML
jgi:hypothetical protein